MEHVEGAACSQMSFQISELHLRHGFVIGIQLRRKRDLGMPFWGQNEFENMPATFEATEEEKTKFPNPEDLQLEQLSCIYVYIYFFT